MRKYCKAYQLKDLRKFREWKEKQNDGEAELSDDDIVYLWDDFTVVRSPVIPDKGLIFDEITSQWQIFCQGTLHFEIPEVLRYAYEQHDSAEASSEEQILSMKEQRHIMLLTAKVE